jgi:hypothetical protein
MGFPSSLFIPFHSHFYSYGIPNKAPAFKLFTQVLFSGKLVLKILFKNLTIELDGQLKNYNLFNGYIAFQLQS